MLWNVKIVMAREKLKVLLGEMVLELNPWLDVEDAMELRIFM